MSPDEGQRRRDNRRGIRFMTMAMLSFICNDALVKYVSQSLPTGQLIVMRGIMACLMILIVARALGMTVRLRDMGQRWVLVRATLEAVASLLYLVALFNIPLPNATAINLSSPLFIAVLAMIFFKERVDTGRWLAIGLGFAGVLMVIQPSGQAFNAFALLTLLSTLLYSGRDLLTRRIPAHIPAMTITLSTALGVMLIGAALLPVQGWQAFEWRHIGLLALAAGFLAGGYYCITQASRQGEFSVVAPFRYTGLMGALVLGYLVWDHVPNTLAWLGIALLIVAGLWMLQREKMRHAQH